MASGRWGAWRRRVWWVVVPAAVAGFAAWAALVDDKKGWTVVSAAVAGVVGAFGPTVADRVAVAREARQRRDESIRSVVSAELPTSVAWLLHPGQAVVAFFGRGSLLQELAAWAADRDAVVVKLLVGAGGVGKTRLAREFAGRLSGWQCRWILPGAEAETAKLIASGSLPARSLLVVDYAETRDRAGVAGLLCAAQQATGVRVLLLARGAGLWWETLSAAYPQQAHLVDALAGAAQVVEVSARIEERDPEEIVADAVRAFAEHLGRPVPPLSSPQGWPTDTPVLRLHAEALVTVLRGAHRHGRYDVLGEVLGHEARYWRFAARRAGLVSVDDPATDLVLRQVVGIAALVGADNPDEVAGIVRRTPLVADADQARVAAYVRWLVSLYPLDSSGGAGLGVVQPDLLAETLAVRVLRDCVPAEQARVFVGLSVGQAVRVLTVLGRARAHQADADVLIDTALAADVPRMVEAVVQMGVQFPGVFTARAVRVLAGVDVDLDWARQVAETIPYPSMELSRLAVAMTTRIVAGFAAGTPAADRARWSATHSVRLSEVGRRAEALTASQEAVDLNRDLVAGDRGAHLPNLAMSVSNHALRLGEVGRRTEALATSQQAVDLYENLAAANRDSYLPSFATAVSNHAIRLSEVGRRTEALTASQQAVDLYGELTGADQNAYLPNLAMSVSNHALRLSEVGRRTEALATSQQAVGLYENLAAANRDAYLPNLAMSVSNHALRLGEVGRRTEALATSQQAVDLYGELSADNRDAYLPNLATAVSNHAIRLSEVGRRTDALTSSQQAIDLYGELTTDNRDAHLPDFATAVSNHAIRLAEVGRRTEALATSQEAVDLYGELTTDNRDAYLPNLATAVTNHAFRLAEVGQRTDALTTSQQAVDLCEDLVAVNRSAYLSSLAMAVNSHAIRLAEVGQRTDALTTSQRAVDLFGELTAANRDAHLPDLAATVSNHAVRLAETGRWADALTASQEAVDLYRNLATANRDAYLANLATAVSNHALRLSDVGRHADAFATSQEAVELYEILVATNRDAYLPDFATAVSNHALRLSDVGRHADALTTSQEAVDLYETLVAGNRDAYLPNLATAIDNHANRLAEAGQAPEAVAAVQKAVDLRRELAAANRGAYLPDLARSLRNVGSVALSVGSITAQVIDLTAEGVRYFEQLAAVEPQAFDQQRQAAQETLVRLRDAATGSAEPDVLGAAGS
ncbi:tetratricopeptide repeat protein [Micromonospora sp. CPCC 205539]|uniref:tetratricopeptide repeat protein n=1 Tax=Micromonospora sp. CPCC 205539 TaxID=3122408 RepID=UPI002FEF9A3A